MQIRILQGQDFRAVHLRLVGDGGVLFGGLRGGVGGGLLGKGKGGGVVFLAGGANGGGLHAYNLKN